ncbi:MAG: penicillin acylase family protein [Bacteroidetes bacterium]|nr:penicillin acylase family protein [Bacteroidota bacterium]
MRKIFLFVIVLITLHTLQAKPFTTAEMNAWKKQAQKVTIIRDQWGIAHVYGKSDADAIFGMLYAQCEDDFPRVELNYINALGRLAEVEGEGKLYNDLRTRLFQDSTLAIQIYKTTPPAMKKLMQAFADGVNYFLATHSNVKPQLIKRFKPWMPLLFSEGSIGGDIEAISLTRLKDFYGDGKDATAIVQDNLDDGLEPEPKGSNGFAIAPSRSVSGNALFMINPHTSFYFRPEIQVVSEEGLQVYGAVTWGQFFIYQGFNESCGWMHTTSMADAIDEYKETVIQNGKSFSYQYGAATRAMQSKKITLAYKVNDEMKKRAFTVYYTHHGPVIAKEGDLWITIKMMQEPLKALTQSYQRTKAKGLIEFQKVMELRTNTSNNTVFADNQGNIAYFHGNFMPKRNPVFNFNRAVDGSNPETEWKGLHEANETVQLINPASGWIQNCNSTPFTAAGSSSPDRNKYPSYMAPDFENARGIHAIDVLSRVSSFTIDKLIEAAYDPYLPAFEKLLPSFLNAYAAKKDEALCAPCDEAIHLLKSWDKKYSITSVEMTIAFYWSQEMRVQMASQIPFGIGQLDIIDRLTQASAEVKVTALKKVLDELQRDFGTWKVAWGDVNRFQRLTGKINETFDDAKPSLPVAFTSSFYGSLAAFGTRKYPGTKKMYGYVGNSFVAAVEFGKRVKAKSVLAGGVSNNPASNHFTDQATLYCEPKFKEVLFYREDVEKHAERKYHPGQLR